MREKLTGLASLLLLLLSLVRLSLSDNQLVPAKPLLFPDNKLISNNGVFAMGFFSPAKSSTRFYIGIWYNNITDRRVVWVANRDKPITTDLSSTTLAVTNLSNLVLSDPNNGVIYWTTAASNNMTAIDSGASAALLDDGNLVLRSSNGSLLWQSFHHPTDTVLPGMPFRVNHHRTRPTADRRLVSWKGPDDPSSGDFSLVGDVSSGIQYFIWHGSSLLWRSGAWSGGMFPSYKLSDAGSVIIETVVGNGDDISLTYKVAEGGSPSMHARMAYTGRYEFNVWNSSASAWNVLDAYPGPRCDPYASCGAFGYCDATAEGTCKCPDGFEPSSGGCARKGESLLLRCRKGETTTTPSFAILPNVKTPARPVFVRNRSYDGCAAECRGNCSCTAYAYANLNSAISGAQLPRCMLWFGELFDMGKYAHMDGENLYLRLTDGSPVQKKSKLLNIVLPVIACLLLLAFAALLWKLKSRGIQKKKKVQNRMMLEYLGSTDEAGNKNMEFPFISFGNIVAATDNFSDSNMLGKGGFGKVYKGMLDGTKEVAIKRLSKNSGQGRGIQK